MQIKMVLCGGPCGGKTISLNKLKNHNNLKNFDIITIEESATFLFSIGYAPNENISPFDFQNLLMKLQYIKEYEAEKKQVLDRKKIIICDRGIIDGSIYIDEGKFQDLLQENNLDFEKIIKTYDFSFYLQSISKSNPNLFQSLRIYETPELGIMRDEKSYDIWRKSKQMINPLHYNEIEDKIDYAAKIILEKYEECCSRSVKLIDLYNDEHLAFIKKSAIDLINKYPPEFKDKQKKLVKKLSKGSD